MNQELENVRIAIIIPAYNEEQRIFQVLNNIQNNLQLLTYNLQLVIIDDGSTDNTFNQVSRAGVKVLKHIVNRGQGAALVTGTKYALRQGADVIVHFDADGQHQVTDIIKLVEPIINNKAEVVLGSRFLRERMNERTNKRMNIKFFGSSVLQFFSSSVQQLLTTKEIPILRRILLLGSLITNSFLTGMLLTDAHNGLRALSCQAAEKINITQDRMAHATEYIQEIKRIDLSYREIPVTIKYRQNSKKSQGFFDGIKILKELILGRISK